MKKNIYYFILCGCVLLLSTPACAQFGRKKVEYKPKERLDTFIADSGEKDKYVEIILGGIIRNFLVHLPPGFNSSKKWPVVFVFHGEGSSAELIAQISQMNEKADKEGFIVVYPNGTGPYKYRLLSWNAWNCCGTALTDRIDDVGFVDVLINKVINEYHADPRRIYATGFSNGAMLTYKVACELSNRIAAIAPVAGALNGKCVPTRMVPMIIFHGILDESVPYLGGRGRMAYEVRNDSAVTYATEFFSYNNNCFGQPYRNEYGNIWEDSYSFCENGSDIKVYSIKNQGHAWPGGTFLGNNGSGQPTDEISATDLMWDFFKSHPLE